MSAKTVLYYLWDYLKRSGRSVVRNCVSTEHWLIDEWQEIVCISFNIHAEATHSAFGVCNMNRRWTVNVQFHHIPQLIAGTRLTISRPPADWGWNYSSAGSLHSPHMPDRGEERITGFYRLLPAVRTTRTQQQIIITVNNDMEERRDMTWSDLKAGAQNQWWRADVWKWKQAERGNRRKFEVKIVTLAVEIEYMWLQEKSESGTRGDRHKTEREEPRTIRY